MRAQLKYEWSGIYSHLKGKEGTQYNSNKKKKKSTHKTNLENKLKTISVPELLPKSYAIHQRNGSFIANAFDVAALLGLKIGL